MSGVTPASVIAMRCRANVFGFLLLALLIFAVFGQALQHGFVNWDDNVHIIMNPDVTGFDLMACLANVRQGIYIPLIHLSFAFEHYRVAIELSPDYAPTHINLGVTYLRAGRADLAQTAFRRALELDPNQPTAWKNLGDLHRSLGEYQSALEAYGEAASLGFSIPVEILAELRELAAASTKD
jgi:tetratricopeptide (TPR) repeat protein